MNENNDELEKEIEQLFCDAWENSPTISGLEDLGEHIAKSILSLSDKELTADQNVFLGEVQFIDEKSNDPRKGKGSLGLHLITASSCPVNELLKNYKPKIADESFIAVMTDNGQGQLTFISFGNGTTITTLLERGDDEVAVTDEQHTREMLAKYPDLNTDKLAELLDRVIEIAKQ